MIKVIALAIASVQTTPTRWFCLLSGYCKHTNMSFLDVSPCSILLTDISTWAVCWTWPTFVELSECTLLLARTAQSNVMLYLLGSVSKQIFFFETIKLYNEDTAVTGTFKVVFLLFICSAAQRPPRLTNWRKLHSKRWDKYAGGKHRPTFKRKELKEAFKM